MERLTSIPVKRPLAKARQRRERTESRPLTALRILLSETIDFLIAAGLSRTDAARELESQRKRVAQSHSSRHRAAAEARVKSEGSLLIGVSGVVHDWHRDVEFTDRRGEPAILDMASLVLLMKRRIKPQRIRSALDWMLDNKVIRRTRNRRFALVRGRSVLLRGKVKQAEALERAAVIVPQYLKLILRNATTADLESRDVERDARVLFLPEKYVALWRALAKERTEAFLEGMDNWLEDHAGEEDSEAVREVGLHVHCYTGDVRFPQR